MTTTPVHIAVTVDVNDLEGMTRFWSELLGVEAEISEPFAFLSPGEGREIAVWLQRVPEPRVGKNRVHLDFRAEVMAEEVARLQGLGARVIAERSLGRLTWTVMADPEGNEFCVSGDA